MIANALRFMGAHHGASGSRRRCRSRRRRRPNPLRRHELWLDSLAYLFGLEQFGIKFGLENISTHRRAARPSRARLSIGPRRRHQRQGLGHGDGRRRAARGGLPCGALHLAASDRSHGAVRDRRPSGVDRRAVRGDRRHPRRDRRAARGRRPGGPADVLRGDDGRRPSSCSGAPASRSPCSRSASAAGSTPPTSSPPVATAITSIAFDHQAYLGSTLREIAFEKAGIIKPARAGRRRPTRPRGRRGHRRGRARSRRHGHPAHRPADVRGFTLGLRGAHQRVNAAVALRLLAGSERARPIHRRLRRLRRGCRTPTGPDGSTSAVSPTDARCCSTRRTTRPEPPRSRPT